MNQHFISSLRLLLADDCCEWNQLPIFSWHLVQAHNIVLGIEFRTRHFEGFFYGDFFCFEIILVALVVHEYVVEVEEKCLSFEHLVGSRPYRAKFIGQLQIECVIS